MRALESLWKTDVVFFPFFMFIVAFLRRQNTSIFWRHFLVLSLPPFPIFSKTQTMEKTTNCVKCQCIVDGERLAGRLM